MNTDENYITITNGGNIVTAYRICPVNIATGLAGETPFSDVIALYRKQAKAVQDTCDLFFCEDMSMLSDMRAAVIACRKTGKPVYVTVTVDKDGCTPAGTPPLAALITLQELGIGAFGIGGCESGFADILPELYRYAKIPLIVKTAAGYTLNKNESKDILEDTSLVFANETQTFHLQADAIEVSDPITCAPDITDELIELNESSYDIIAVNINTPDDAAEFAGNANMAALPVMFVSNDKDALNAALMHYQGRALVDSQFFTDKAELRHIAEKYGAVVY